MGLIYWNIINTLLQKPTNEPILYFNMIKYIINGDGPKKECDIMYSIPITYFNFEKCIEFKNNNDNCLKSFIICVDGKKDEIVDLYNLPISKTNEIIRYVDNKDKPYNSNHRMSHTPFIIFGSKMYKLPDKDDLKFVKNGENIEIKLKNENYKHVNYKGITTYHKEIRTIKDKIFKSDIILSFKTDYEKYLNENGNKKEDEYKFMCKIKF